MRNCQRMTDRCIKLTTTPHTKVTSSNKVISQTKSAFPELPAFKVSFLPVSINSCHVRYNVFILSIKGLWKEIPPDCSKIEAAILGHIFPPLSRETHEKRNSNMKILLKLSLCIISCWTFTFKEIILRNLVIRKMS